MCELGTSAIPASTRRGWRSLVTKCLHCGSGSDRHNPHVHRRSDFHEAAWDDIEAQWVLAMASDDESGEAGQAAFWKLFEAYHHLLVRQLCRCGMDEHQAWDRTHDLLVAFARKASTHDPVTPVRLHLKGYLDTALRHYLRDTARSASRHIGIPDDVADLATDAALFEPGLTIRDPATQFDFLRCVRRAFAAFEQAHPRLARLLLLRHVLENTLEEMAGQLGEDAVKLKADVHSARGKFAPRAKPCLELLAP